MCEPVSHGRILHAACRFTGVDMAERRVTETFVVLADTLADPFDVIDLLHELTHRCVELLDVQARGVDAGRSRAVPAGVVPPRSQAARLLEVFQLQHDEGPCLDAYRSGRQVTESDFRTSGQRWPRFSPRAVEAGYRSVQSLPMRLHGEVLGAMNLFGASVPEPLSTGTSSPSPRCSPTSPPSASCRTGSPATGRLLNEQLDARADQPGGHRAGHGDRGRPPDHGRRPGLRAAAVGVPPAQPPAERRSPRTSSPVRSTCCRCTDDPYLAPARRRIVRGAGAAPDPGWPAVLACAGGRV